MSVKVSGHIWDQELKPTLKFVLLALGDVADHKGGRIFPSVALVSYMTGYSERTIQNSIKELVKMGVLKFVRKHPKYRTNEYRYMWVNLLHPAGKDKRAPQEKTAIGESPAPNPLESIKVQPSVETDDSIFPFKVKEPIPVERINATDAGRLIMEGIIFPLMPGAVELFGTIAGAAAAHGQDETERALRIAYNDWIETSGKNGRSYNPHNYGWVEWGINYLASGKKSWKEPNYGKDTQDCPGYTQQDRDLAQQIRAERR